MALDVLLSNLPARRRRPALHPRHGLPIGLIFAGLPSAVSDLPNEGVATFLQRADRINLHGAAIAEVTASYCEPFNHGGISISPDLLNKAAEATEGYPFLIQLVRYFLWLEAGKESWKLDHSSVQHAITAAKDRTRWWSSGQHSWTFRTKTVSSSTPGRPGRPLGGRSDRRHEG